MTITPAVLTSIVVTPTGPSIAKGTTVQLTATGNLFGRDHSGSHRLGELDFLGCEPWQRLTPTAW